MARKPRLHYPGALYHVMLRGNGGQAIFFDDADRYHLGLLAQAGIERYGHRIHGYCFMGNHIHLALQVGEVPLSRIIQNLTFRYTRWINKHQGRTGHLFQGRYKAILVDADSYLLELVRYIHLNPVRAGLVREAKAYRWSSHRVYLAREPLPWLTTHWVLSQFSKHVGHARRQYARFVQAGVGQGYQEEFHRGTDKGRILGDDRFIAKALKRAGAGVETAVDLNTVIQAVCEAYKIKPDQLVWSTKQRTRSEARSVLAWIIREYTPIKLTELASHLKRDPASLSMSIKRLLDKAERDAAVRRRMQKVYRAIKS